MPRSGGALLRAVMLTLALATLVALPASASAAASERYGVVDSSLRVQSPATQRAALGVLFGGGVRVVRSDMSWDHVETSAPGADGVHRYDWSKHDAWVTTLAQSGLRLYPIIDYSTPWASAGGTWNSRPRNAADYAAFAAAVVARYGATGSFWNEHPDVPRLPVQSVEIWNEENAAQFWAEQSTAPRDYGQLYLAARAAVKSVAPSTEVVVGGLVDRGAESFIKNMVASNPALAGNVDAVAFHGYLLAPVDLMNRITSVRRAMDGVGLSQASISLTEVGWSALEGSDDMRGQYLADISRLSSDPALKVNRVIAYAAMSNEGDPNQWDQWFGLLNHDVTPKSTFVKWAAQIAALQVSGAVTNTTQAATTALTTVTNAVATSTKTVANTATKATKAPAKTATKTAKAKKRTSAAAKRKAAAGRKARAAKARAAKARAAKARAAKARAAAKR